MPLATRPVSYARHATIKVNKTHDDDARRQFEEWAKVTGRHGRIVWSSVKVDQSDPSTTVVAFRIAV